VPSHAGAALDASASGTLTGIVTGRADGMKPQIVLLLVLGIVLGPLYYAYCMYFSGRTVETHALTERAERWSLPDGAIVRFRGGAGYKPIALGLDPEMNWLKLRFSFSRPAADAGKEELQYLLSLQDGDHTVLHRTLSLRLAAGEKRDLDVGPLEIPYAGRFVLLLEEVGMPAVIPDISLAIIANADKANSIVVWTGLSLLIVAFALQMHALWTAQRRAV
jgi:hypothetical protein